MLQSRDGQTTPQQNVVFKSRPPFSFYAPPNDCVLSFQIFFKEFTGFLGYSTVHQPEEAFIIFLEKKYSDE